MSRIILFFRRLAAARASRATREATLQFQIDQLSSLVEYNDENLRVHVGRVTVDSFSLLLQMAEALKQQQRRISTLETLVGRRNVDRANRRANRQAEENGQEFRMPAEVEAGL